MFNGEQKYSFTVDFDLGQLPMLHQDEGVSQQLHDLPH